MKILLITFSLIAIFAVIILSVFFYGITQNPKFEEIIKIWADFGDFMGGTLNPILSALSLFGLLFTIYYQNKELEETRKELKESRIAQQEQSESLKLQNKATKLQIFENTFFQLNNIFSNARLNLNYELRKPFQESTVFSSSGTISFFLEELKKYTSYDIFNDKYEKYSGIYTGQIYQILKFINDNNIENKQRYVNIFRAQFTKDELEFLFYHCLGRSKFKKLVEDYEFFEHIILNNDIKKQLLEYDKKAFGKNERILESYDNLKKEAVSGE